MTSLNQSLPSHVEPCSVRQVINNTYRQAPFYNRKGTKQTTKGGREVEKFYKWMDDDSYLLCCYSLPTLPLQAYYFVTFICTKKTL